jgi:CHASE3 domain sensor protein
MRDVNMRKFIEHYSALLEDLSKAVEEQKNEKVDKKLTLQEVLGSLTEVQDLVKQERKAKRQKEIEQKAVLDAGVQRMHQIEQHHHHYYEGLK